MMNSWDLNKKLNVWKKVQPILGSRTKIRKKSLVQHDDSSQTPTPRPSISEVSHWILWVCKILKKKNKINKIIDSFFSNHVQLTFNSHLKFHFSFSFYKWDLKWFCENLWDFHYTGAAIFKGTSSKVMRSNHYN